ncbi:MAG: L-2-hydroxyglutarate oxidase LhgO [Candidatus Azotimanducaceae bacterium]|jgi:L-2-hydroxyglutarate oxidase LhgO
MPHNSEMDRVQNIVIGGGVVGLAIAAELAANGREVLVLERGSEIGQGISSRNSEVIHAGIYYAEGSLKGRLCMAGKQRLYEYCHERSIPHRRLGKLIVASSHGETDILEDIVDRARRNGVNDLEPLSQLQIKQLEPAVSGVAGLLSPSTGIVSAHDLMNSLAGDITNLGGQIANHCDVKRVLRGVDGFEVICDIEGENYQLGCDQLINAAGLSAQSVARACEFLPPSAQVPALHLCRGTYFSYSAKSPFQHLIYPVPEQNSVGLGIHATLDIGYQLKFGPDTEYLSAEDYRLPDQVPASYIAAIQRYFPALDVSKLSPSYVGIRPKLSAAGEAAADFLIEGQDQHGIDGYIQLFGIESPGLTASLAIGEYVRNQLDTMRA